MLTFDEARARVLSDVRGTGTERVGLTGAAGRVLAEDLRAYRPIPRFDHSAMDGYALCAVDLVGEPPYVLPVAFEVAAGGSGAPLPPGTACRIFTGARLPPRADTVVMQEHVRVTGGAAALDARPKPGQHVRRTGEDLAEGAVGLARGTRLSAGAIALAAMLDRAELEVARRPVVTILSTGDELRAPGGAGADTGSASIPESNGPALAALAGQAGAIVHLCPIAKDDLEATTRAIGLALRTADLLLTIGGVSVGDHDLVKPALAAAGVTLDFWKVAIKPGKPLAVGRHASGAHVLGLPGNPASALVTFGIFGLPLLRAMQGDRRPLPPRLVARLGRVTKRSPDRLELVRVALDVEDGHLVTRAHMNQASGAATSLAESDGLALVPPGPSPLDAGAAIDVVRWSDL